MRRLIAFPCADETLVGSLDEAPGRTGLLIVSGGNEVRAGAHRGMAMLAARLAARGTPVLRYDRRGIGDSTGDNAGFAGARDDLLAAAAAFRAAGIERIVGFGNCDAASALAAWGRDAGLAAVVLANPWVVEPVDDLPPPAAIRARYAAALRDPATLRRALSGRISFAKLARGLLRLVRRLETGSETLAQRVLAGIAAWGGNATLVLARGDATAIAYADAARSAGAAPRTVTIDTASHSFASDEDGAALEDAIVEALARAG